MNQPDTGHEVIPETLDDRDRRDSDLDRLAREWLDSGVFSTELYRALSLRVAGMAHHVARRLGIPRAAEDIEQEAVTLLVEKAEWRPEDGPLAPYLFGYVWRYGLKLARKTNPPNIVRVGNWHDETEFRVQEKEGGGYLNPIETEAEKAHREHLLRGLDTKAIDRALADLESSPSGPGPKKERRGSAKAHKGRKKDRRHRRGNLRLEEIRIRAALSRREIAAGIGLSEWEYQAYETGKRAHTPAWVYEAAQRFAENARPPWDFAWLHIASGHQIVSEWERLLGVEYTDPLMSEVTRIGSKTLQQWYNATEQTPRKSLTRQGRAHDLVLSYVEGDNH